MKKIVILGLVLAWPLWTQAVRIEEPVPAGHIKASASSTFSLPQDCRHLVDGSGLSGDRHDNNAGAGTMWHTVEKPAEAWVRFDFAEPVTLSAVRIWNHNLSGLQNRGFRQARLLASSDGATWTSQAIELKRGDGLPERIPLEAKTAVVSVMIAGDSNYGGNVYGLSEVQFMMAREVAEKDLPFPAGMEARPQPFYRHRPDGKPGRAVTLAMNGVKLYGDVTVEVLGETTRFAGLQGEGELTVLLPDGVGVKEACEATVTLRQGERSLAQAVVVPPKRQWTVYIYPHSHVDIGYTTSQEIVEKIHLRNLDVGIDLGRKTARYPEGARHVWNPETTWVVESYWRQASDEQKAAFVEAVKKGWIGLDANYANSNTSAMSEEEILRFFRKGAELRRLTGAPVDTMVQFDIPGMSWGVVQAAAQCGVRGVFCFTNDFARVGAARRMEQKPFWWVAPDGKTRVLFVQGCPYGMAGFQLKGKFMVSRPYRSAEDRYPESLIGKIPNAVQEYRKDMDRWQSENPGEHFIDTDNPADNGQIHVFRDLERLEREGSPYDIYPMTWSLADNSFVDADLPEAVKAWNEKHAYPKFVICDAHTILAAFEKKFGDIIPEMRGDYTEYWTDGLGSDALRTGYNRLAKERLVQAETLGAMLRQPLPPEVLDEAWRWVFLGSEHTWGYGDPAAAFAKGVEATKASYFENADKTSRNLLTQALAPVAKPDSDMIAVFNTLAWPRSGLVALPPNVAGIEGETIQKLSTGETVFLATEVPALGMRTYRVGAGRPEGNGCKVAGQTLENGIVSVTLDPKTGDIASLVHNGVEFIDGAANSYHYLRGNDAPAKAGRPTAVAISVKENGPLVASLLVESQAEGCRKLLREIRIIAGHPQVEIINTLDKLSTRQKEGVHFGFAFKVPGGTMRMDIPYGVMNPVTDQLVAANKNWLAFQRWIDVSNDQAGITWAGLEAPLVEVGEISANITGDGPGWRKSIAPTQTLYSWALNNHWYTNFPLEQGGIIPFRYALLPHHTGYDPVASNRFGLEQNRPLIVSPVRNDATLAPLFTVGNPRVMVSSISSERDDLAITLRSLSEQKETVRLGDKTVDLLPNGVVNLRLKP